MEGIPFFKKNNIEREKKIISRSSLAALILGLGVYSCESAYQNEQSQETQIEVDSPGSHEGNLEEIFHYEQEEFLEERSALNAKLDRLIATGSEVNLLPEVIVDDRFFSSMFVSYSRHLFPDTLSSEKVASILDEANHQLGDYSNSDFENMNPLFALGDEKFSMGLDFLHRDLEDKLLGASDRSIDIKRFKIQLILARNQEKGEVITYVGLGDFHTGSFVVDNDPVTFHIDEETDINSIKLFFNSLKQKIIENTLQAQSFGKEVVYGSPAMNLSQESTVQESRLGLDDRSKKILKENENLRFVFSFKEDNKLGVTLTAGQVLAVGGLSFSSLESFNIFSPSGDLLYRGNIKKLLQETFLAQEDKDALNEIKSLKLNFELRDIGKVDFGEIIFGFSFKQINAGPYQILEQVDIENPDYRFTDTDISSQIREAVSETEMLFGFQPSELVKTIFANKLDPGTGGTYNPADSITIHIDATRPLVGNTLRTIIVHEIAHLVNDRLDLTYKDDPEDNDDKDIIQFLEKYNQLRKSNSFENLGEGHLLRYDYLSEENGHPEDNSDEFFASIVSSLFMTAPEKTLFSHSSELRQLYRSALESVLIRLESSNDISATAPVLSKIKERINLIDTIEEKN